MGWKRTGAVALTTTALAGVALGQPAQKVTGPIAEYWVSAATSSGMTMPGAGGPPAGPPAGRPPSPRSTRRPSARRLTAAMP